MDHAIFKTEEIRGIYPDQLNEEDARKIGFAAAKFLLSKVSDEGNLTDSPSIVVGRDMRIHSESLAKTLIEGIRSAGATAVDIGMVDTPQVYFAINHLNALGGVQTTASHNPAKYNGFKISGSGAIPVGGDTGLTDIKQLAITLSPTKDKPCGLLKKVNLTSEYKNHVLKALSPNIARLKIAIDASNGMAGKMVPAIFGDLPIEIIDINFEHTGKFKHEPNPLVEKNLSQVKAAVKEKRCDFGICFDGDADRLMMVDEKSQTIGCDLITTLMVPYFLEKQPKSAIVYDLRSSRVVVEETLKYGGTPRRERVGHAFMKKAMRDSRAVFGGELSGHFYFRDNYCTDSGLITLVHVLNIVSESKRPISELIKPLRRYSSSGEINFKVENKKAKMNELERKYSDGRVDHLDGVTVTYKDWWLNCRPSNTEPLLRLNVEARTEESLVEKLSQIEAILGKPV
jgi:phosphomannomutase